MGFVNEDLIQVLDNTKKEVFRDLRVCSIAKVVAVNGLTVDVQLLVADVSNGVSIPPPVVKNLRVVGSAMPSEGAQGVVLHFDRKNNISGELSESGGPAHEINYGVFLPIVE